MYICEEQKIYSYEKNIKRLCFLEGSINGVESAGKLNVLKQLMYFPHLFLHLNKVTIDGKSKNIPNDFGNDNRMLTFIEL